MSLSQIESKAAALHLSVSGMSAAVVHRGFLKKYGKLYFIIIILCLLLFVFVSYFNVLVTFVCHQLRYLSTQFKIVGNTFQ